MPLWKSNAFGHSRERLKVALIPQRALVGVAGLDDFLEKAAERERWQVHGLQRLTEKSFGNRLNRFSRKWARFQSRMSGAPTKRSSCKLWNRWQPRTSGFIISVSTPFQKFLHLILPHLVFDNFFNHLRIRLRIFKLCIAQYAFNRSDLLCFFFRFVSCYFDLSQHNTGRIDTIGKFDTDAYACANVVGARMATNTFPDTKLRRVS